jgi:predicted nucleic acid-binding protein
MSAETFLDTNVLIYCFDDTAPRKKAIAIELVKTALSKPGKMVISWQVAQEFLNAMLHKVKRRLSPEDAYRYTQAVLTPLCQIHSRPTFWTSALRLQQETGYQFYDCLVLVSAQESGARRILTEDMQDGRMIGSLRIENPFL